MRWARHNPVLPLILLLSSAAACGLAAAAEDPELTQLKDENERLKWAKKDLELKVRDLSERLDRITEVHVAEGKLMNQLLQEREKQRDRLAERDKDNMVLRETVLRLFLDLHHDSRKKATDAFLLGLASPKEAERRAAIDAVKPTAKDLEVLFPHFSEETRKDLLATFEKQLGDGTALAARFKSAAKDGALWAPIRYVDPKNQRYRHVLLQIPRQIPLFGYAILHEDKPFSEEATWLCDFALVGDRWVCLPDLVTALEPPKPKP